MTETSAGVATYFANEYIARQDICGLATAIAQLQIRELKDGRIVLPVGEVGELCPFGPMKCRGYWNKPDATAAPYGRLGAHL